MNTVFQQCETVIVRHYGKKYQNGGTFFSAIICLFSMIFFVVTDKGGFYFPKELWGYGLFSCAMYSAGFYYMYAALKVGSFALTKLFAAFSGIVAIFYGILVLKEDANYLTYIAIFLMFVSVFGLILERKRLVSILKTGSLYGAFAGICNGLTNFTGIVLYSLISVSFITPFTTGLGIVTGFLISVLFYKEKFTRLQYASAIVGIIALVLLKVSQSL